MIQLMAVTIRDMRESLASSFVRATIAIIATFYSPSAAASVSRRLLRFCKPSCSFFRNRIVGIVPLGQLQQLI
jgi:hypothetical protein